MIKQKLNISSLIPQAYGGVYKKRVEYQINILEKEENLQEIICLSESNEKYYVIDGHHRTIACMKLNQKPLAIILENSEDLRKFFGGGINTTNLELARNRSKKFYELCKGHNIKNFSDLEKIIK